MSDKPNLLSLPVEIKLQIYSYLDCDPSPIEYPLAEPLCSQASYILTCRQLRYELQHEFFSKNVFAIRFNSDGQMSSTKHPSLIEIDTLGLKRIDNLQPLDFGFQYDYDMLEPHGKQRITDLRPFDGCSALSEDITKIEDLQLHVLHRRLYAIHPITLYQMLRPMALPNMLPDYISKCKEQLEVVLEALARAKSMKGLLGLKKLTVVNNVPYIGQTRPLSALCDNTRKELKVLLADAYWPILAQAAATLGINIENVKIYIYENWHNYQC